MTTPSFANVEFDDLFPYNGKEPDASPEDLEISLDSPMSLEVELHRDDVDMGLLSQNTLASVSPPPLMDDHFNSSGAMSPGFADDDQSEMSSRTNTPSPIPNEGLSEQEIIESDRRLLAIRMKPFEKFPMVNNWTQKQKFERLLELSPCTKYTLEFLMALDEIEDAELKVDILIELVCRIHLDFWWNHVTPQELKRAYTSASFCKKEKKKDSDGLVNPKRPMNAFMIWSKQCRSLIAQVCPQLHNATISKKLGVWWRKFSNEEKDVFEREKVKLTAFHAFEFPEYKYRPRKKATKKTEEKLETAPKEKSSSKKRKSPTTKQTNQPQQQQQQQQQNRQSPLRGINISEPRANLDPALLRKLQSKMNVKIDPGMRRDVTLSQQGNRCTAINLADLPHLHSADHSSSDGPAMKRLCLRPIEVQQTPVAPTTIDLADSATVFDTPGNSPHTPVTPVTPIESNLNMVSSTQGQTSFDFTMPSSRVPVMMEQVSPGAGNNSNIIVSSSSGTSQFVFPVRPVYNNSNIIATINNRIISENNNNNIIINNNNALLQNNNITVKEEPFLFQGRNVIVKTEPILLNEAVSLKPEPVFVQSGNITLKPETLIQCTNTTPTTAIKPELLSPQAQWSVSIKTEPDFDQTIVKSEPDVTDLNPSLEMDFIPQLPNLSVDIVAEVLDAPQYNDNQLVETRVNQYNDNQLADAGVTQYSNDNQLVETRVNQYNDNQLVETRVNQYNDNQLADAGVTQYSNDNQLVETRVNQYNDNQLVETRVNQYNDNQLADAGVTQYSNDNQLAQLRIVQQSAENPHEILNDILKVIQTANPFGILEGPATV